MKRFVLSTLVVTFTLTAAVAVMSAKPSPVRYTSTLLSLYARSDVILIGRYDKRQEFGTNRVADGFMVVSIRTHFDVTTVLKGEPRKFAVIEEEEFRYQVQGDDEAPRDAVFIDDLESRVADNDPRPGDTVMLFLTGKGDSLELADRRDGIRKLSAPSEAVITQRINELNAIFEAEKLDSSKLAAWLVRCVEQPETRWDGTHELLQGLRHVEWKRQPDANGYERIDPSVSKRFGEDAAQALDKGMKSALTQILISADAGAELSAGKKASLSIGDRELIGLVKRWDPILAAGHLLGRLRSRAYSFHENSGMMFKIAELIDVEQIARAANKYAELTAADPVASATNAVSERTETLRATALDGFLKVTCYELTRLSAASKDDGRES